MSNLKKTTNCANEGELMAYLYNEMLSASRTQFESHFAECSACIDAFAELADSRYSVYEWQQIEFAPLKTPVIEIPYSPATSRSSWIESLKAAFTLRPQMAFAGAVGAMLMAMVIGYALWSGGTNTVDVATVPKADETASAVANTAGIAADTTALVTNGEADYNAAERKVQTPQAIPVIQRKSESRSIREPRRSPRVRVQPVERVTTITATQTAPRLNDFEDVSDDSLRLTDLFDDIEISE